MNALAILNVAVGDRHEHGLNRRNPDRKRACEVLDPDSEEALRVGRTLFDTPSPISAQEISDLMNRLESREQEQNTRESALEQRELHLNNMMDDLERNRANVMSMAKAIEAEGLLSGATPEQTTPAIDDANLGRVAPAQSNQS